jgi:translation initiation factor 4E
MTAEVIMSSELEIENQNEKEATGEIAEKHSLQNTWCLWVNMSSPSKKAQKQDWNTNNAMVHSLSTVEEFWCLYNNINGPSCLGNGDVSFFKKGIAPAWEDKSCSSGGRWVVKLEGKVRPETMDETWLNLILALIGEQTFEETDNDLVCGAVLSSRAKGTSKLALWMKTTEKEAMARVGNKYVEILRGTLGGAGSDQVSFENFSKQVYEKHLKL